MKLREAARLAPFFMIGSNRNLLTLTWWIVSVQTQITIAAFRV